jgi:hypothetical protein
VRPLLVVVLVPRLDNGPGLGHRGEPVLVEALVPQLAVEALDEGVLHRLARLDEVQPHPSLVGPGIQRLPGKLWAVVDDDRELELSIIIGFLLVVAGLAELLGFGLP